MFLADSVCHGVDGSQNEFQQPESVDDIKMGKSPAQNIAPEMQAA
jgi:hypothetical protein